MAQIRVDTVGGSVFRVTIEDGRHQTTHEVRVTPEDVERYTAGGHTPERLIEASFEFLLQREPAGAILATFALPVIERYFPEYPRVIRQML